MELHVPLSVAKLYFSLNTNACAGEEQKIYTFILIKHILTANEDEKVYL